LLGKLTVGRRINYPGSSTKGGGRHRPLVRGNKFVVKSGKKGQKRCFPEREAKMDHRCGKTNGGRVWRVQKKKETKGGPIHLLYVSRVGEGPTTQKRSLRGGGRGKGCYKNPLDERGGGLKRRVQKALEGQNSIKGKGEKRGKKLATGGG